MALLKKCRYNYDRLLQVRGLAQSRRCGAVGEGGKQLEFLLKAGLQQRILRIPLWNHAASDKNQIREPGERG